MKKRIDEIINSSIDLKKRVLADCALDIENAAKLIIGSLKAGGKLLIFGNGGSASDSQHIAAELVGRFRKERQPLAAIALTVNTSVMTAIANDYGYDTVFSRQIEALGKKGDAALAISTSGKSENIIAAGRKARELGIKVIGLIGRDGGTLKDVSDIAIIVKSDDTPRIQESHAMIGHILCELVEEGFLK